MSDARKFRELFANDKILKNLLTEMKARDVTLAHEKKWIKNLLKMYKKKKPEKYSLAITADGEIVGSIGFNKPDYDNQNVEFGYWIGEEYWGRGYATKAIKEFVKILFNKFKFVRVTASPFSYNKASQKVLQKAGLKLEGKRRKAVKKKGKFIDDAVYSKVR